MGAKRLGIVLALIMVLAAGSAWAADGCRGGCGACYNPCPQPKTCTIMQPVTVMEEVTVLRPFTNCGPCGQKRMTLVPVKINVEKKVMRPVEVTCCGADCCN